MHASTVCVFRTMQASLPASECGRVIRWGRANYNCRALCARALVIIHARMHVCRYVFLCFCVSVFLCFCVYACVYALVQVCLCACILHAGIHPCMRVCMNCTCAGMHVCTHACIRHAASVSFAQQAVFFPLHRDSILRSSRAASAPLLPGHLLGSTVSLAPGDGCSVVDIAMA